MARQADRIHAAGDDERAAANITGRSGSSPAPACALPRQRLGLTLDAGAEDRLMNQYRHLSAPSPKTARCWPNCSAGGVPAGILSNGDPEMLAVAVKSAGFAELLQHVISVHPVRRYKTDPAAYALGPAAFGLPAREILFVSSNGWDAIGATWFGYTHAVGQPHRRAAGPAGHRAQPHRPQPARRAGPLSCTRFGRRRRPPGLATLPLKRAIPSRRTP